MPYVILSVASALLNHFLHLPPFSLLLVALTLTDGASHVGVGHFGGKTDYYPRYDVDILFQREGYR